jgi:hypothetical protein
VALFALVDCKNLYAATKTLAKAANRFAKKDRTQDGVGILTDAAAIDTPWRRCR